MTNPHLGADEIEALLAALDRLAPPETDSTTYAAGYVHGVIDATEAVRKAWQRAGSTAYAAALDADADDAPAPADDAGLGELADVAKSLLGLAVRLDAADQADIDKRLDALGGGARV